MVLIFSAYSNTSEQVLREVQLAANSHLHIVQFRIADVLPNDDLEYYLSTPHWLDALTLPLERHLDRLTSSVKALLNMAADESAATPAPIFPKQPVIAPVPSASEPKRPVGKGNPMLWIVGIAAIAAAAIVALYLSRPKPQPRSVSDIQATPSATLATSATVAPPIAPAATGLNPAFAFVDMNRVFKEYRKTKDAETKINDVKNAAKKEYDTRADAYKRKLDSINAMSAGSSKDRAITELKEMEKEINEFRTTREKELQTQALEMRRVIVNEIETHVLELVDPENNLVIDRSGNSLNGVPVLLFCAASADMTDRVISDLNGAKEGGPQRTRPADCLCRYESNF
jgi:Skp family chaperone for outer membrane proteins